MSESDTDFFLSILRNFLEHFFYRTLPYDCFWWIALMVKNVNSVSLFFLNSQLYHAPLEWWLLFWCNEKYFLIKKTWLNYKSQTLSLTLFQRHRSSHLWCSVKKGVLRNFPKFTGKYLCQFIKIETLAYCWTQSSINVYSVSWK